MLCAYYDISFKDEFDVIFKDTYILNHQTPLKNSFYIMKFDFSGVDITDYKESFRKDLLIVSKEFTLKYKLDINLENINPIDDLKMVFNYCSKKVKLILNLFCKGINSKFTTWLKNLIYF